MIFFHKLRCHLARKRFEKALDNVSVAEFKRMCAMQQWFDSIRLVPGDKVTIVFDDLFRVSEESRENRKSDILFNPNEFPEL